ncbi:glucuronate isomerase [uncultured Megasphaera sp.]|uniref:glucuronate isomerase n=1 Tax=uncultured Megasphaera sp. TaxID=165188 RepID=UPI0025F6BE06|nr:glucuronate isomerase [uncultured Megasphaera sp.]
MSFLDDDFLLTNEPAKRLYHEHAEKMPIIDYHCHLDPKDIYENKNYPNLTRVWLNDGMLGDHYKWRLERANGVPEELITGDGDEYEKMLAWGKTLEKAIGNPIYEWANLELKRFFSIDEPVFEKNISTIWEKANALLQTEDFKPRSLIKNAKVKVLCTTDDLNSDLKYHQLIAKEEKDFRVLPSMRPDGLFKIYNDTYPAYIAKLSDLTDIDVQDVDSLKNALDKRFAFFDQVGGHVSDFGLDTYYYHKVSKNEMNELIQKGIKGIALSGDEISGYQTGLLQLFMELNKKYDWVMQLHVNVLRNMNQSMYRAIGADKGFDSAGSQSGIARELLYLLNDGVASDVLPKTILYSTNPNDWMELATGMQSFQGGCRQRLQLGCAWWFNDTREGMQLQLTTMAQQSLLGNFVGMLTDSRSFLSYPRHEYFRRVLCNLIGEWVERGQVVEDYDYLGKIVEDISFNNANEYFRFFVK